MKVTLEAEDIDVLVEALDAWISKDFGFNVLTTVLSGMIPKGEEREKYMAQQENKMASQEVLQLERKRMARILQGKLLAATQENEEVQ